MGLPGLSPGALRGLHENLTAAHGGGVADARALAVRISRGTMTESRALAIARAWLHDNPKRIHGLE